MGARFYRNTILISNFGDEAHHEEYPFSYRILYRGRRHSFCRPSWRSPRRVENYLKRLENLEKIATSFEGVNCLRFIGRPRDSALSWFRWQFRRQWRNGFKVTVEVSGEIKVNVIGKRRMRSSRRLFSRNPFRLDKAITPVYFGMKLNSCLPPISKF